MRNCVYVVYRHGANAANQGACNKKIVGTIKAGSREEACKRMASEVTVYHNQHLEAVPLSRLGKTDQRLAAECDVWRAAVCDAWLEVARDIERGRLQGRR